MAKQEAALGSRRRLALESLEGRELMTVSATFAPGTGLLDIFIDSNSITDPVGQQETVRLASDSTGNRVRILNSQNTSLVVFGDDANPVTSVMVTMIGTNPVNAGLGGLLDLNPASPGADAGPGNPFGTFNEPIVVTGGMDADTVIARPINQTTINAGGGNDSIQLSGTGPTGANTVVVDGGANDDSFVLGNGLSLNGGTINGGDGVDTIDYSAFTTPIQVNLGLQNNLTASLDGGQENPPATTAANGTAAVSYNALTRQATVSMTVNSLVNPIVDAHIHLREIGANGPVIVPIGAGVFVPTGIPGQFTANFVSSIPSVNEAAFLGGLTYFNIHTNPGFPGGEIRGQIQPGTNISLATGTATGTAGISNTENVFGGSGNDSLVGNNLANTLNGNAGNDVIVGGPGADTFFGGANNDTMAWNPGDGTDVMDGQADIDTVQLNGGNAAEIFVVNPNGTRVSFARTSPGPFNLDVGTTEVLRLNANGGDDSVTVNNLAGVADLTTVSLFGQDGNDTFSLPAFPVAAVTVNVIGGTHPAGDALNIDAGGGPVNDSGTALTKAGAGPVNYRQIETLGIANPGNVVVAGTAGNDNLVVNATGPNSGTYSFNGGPAVAFAGLTNLTFNADAGSDTLTINNPAGGLFAPTGGIDYNGGGNPGDALHLLGGGGAGINQIYFVGTTTPPIGAGPGNSGDGLIRFTGTSAVDIRFTGLAPIVDTVVAASLTVNSTDAANNISVTNGVAPRLVVAVDAFEPIEFNNKTALIINAGDGFAGGDLADTVLLNFTNLPAGLTSVTVNADEGADTVSLQASSNVPVTLNGGDGLDVINVGNNGTLGTPGLLTPVVGPVNVNGGAGGANLTVDGTGAGVPANYNVTATTVTRTLPAGFGGVTYSNLSTLLLATGAGPNVVTVSSTSVPTTVDANLGIDTLIVTTPNAISVYEQGGNYAFELGMPGGLTALDFENINLQPGNGVLNIVGDEGQGTNVGGAGVNDTDLVEVYGTAQNAGVLRLNNIALPQVVTFAGVTNLNVNTFDLDDDVILDPFASTTQTWNLVVNVNSGAGDDDVVYGNANVVPVADPVPNGSVAGVSENVTVTPVLIPGTGEIAVPGVVTIHFQETEDLSFLLNNGTAGDSDRLTIQGTDSNLSDAFTIRPDAAGNDAEPVVDLDISAVQMLQIENISAVAPGGAQFFVTALNFEGLNGSDIFNLRPSASGTVLNIDGGAPTFNSLSADRVVIDALADPTNQVSIQAGATNDSGTVVSNLAGVPRAAVNFLSVEAVAVNNSSAATIIGNNANNAITVVGTAAAALTANVDGGPTLELNGVTSLQVNALAGDDTISLTAGPLAIASITVNGGDPTASDTLIINGTGGNDTINYNVSNTVGAGSVVIAGAPVVNFTTTESLHIDGQGGTDALTVTSPSGHRTTVTPGSAADSGSIGSQGFGAGTASVPLTYSHIGALGTVTIAGVGDIVEFNGTANSDTFSLTGTTVQITNATFGFVTNLFNLTNVFQVELRGHDGDDTFSITGTPVASFAGGVFVDGGNPSASDVLNLVAPSAAVVVNLSSQTVTGYGSQVTMIGVETLNANAGTGNLTVNGSSGDDSLQVTPTGLNSATFRLTESNPSVGSTPVVNGSNIGTLNVDLLGGSDTLVVRGTTAGEAITVTGALVTIGALETVNFSGTEALSVLAQQGADTITVTPGAIPIFIDGGDPIGTIPGDSLTVNAAVGFFAGPENDEGGVLTAGGAVSFDHIEALVVAAMAGCPFLILGTNADDDITVIARDNTTTAGADGIQDMTFSINDGINVTLLNQADLFIDAMAGDDDIVIRAGAPNGADWDVNVRVAGGSPSIGAPLEADRLVLETPNAAAGFDNIVFNPTGADTGSLIMDENANGAYDFGAGDTDSLITFGSFVFNCPPALFTYTSTAGGVELIQYNGEGAPTISDRLTINGTAFDDTTVVNQGGVGSGTFSAPGDSPLFQFQSFDTLTVNPDVLGYVGPERGFDLVEINGTVGPDTITSTANAVTLVTAVTLGQGINQLNINTFDGNDNVDLDLTLTGLKKVINLGSGNDAADLSGVIVDPADPIIYGGDGDDNIVGSPNVDFIYGGSGTDIILGLGDVDYIEGGDGNDTITGGTGNDVLHGGDGSDVIIWNNGDNTDVVEGGTGDDRAVVNGAGAGDVFTVFADATNPSRIAFNRTNLVAFSLDIADVEELDVNSGTGADNITVGDLTTTALRNLDLDLGVEAGIADTVTVNGRNIADNVQMTGAGNGMTIAGLRYDVRVINALAAENDDFTFTANSGDDSVTAADSVAGFFTSSDVAANNRFRILGGDGNDQLSGYGSLSGQAGDDTLMGSTTIAAANGNQLLIGGDGDDTMLGGTGNDTFDGGAGIDTILVRGTPGNDSIDIDQTAATTLAETVNGVLETDTLVLVAGVRTVERVNVQAGDGNDIIRVQWADALGTDANVNSLAVNVDGGSGATGDRVGVVDLGTGDLILLEHGNTSDAGAMSIGPGNAEPLIMTYTNVETAQPIPGNGGDVVVFKHDPFEHNNIRTAATFLGANSSINVDPTINPGVSVPFGFPADEDWYRVVAETTGVLDFQVYFRQVATVASGRPGLPNAGNLDISVTDAAGTVIAGFGVNDANNDERVRIPAVQGQTYYLRVFANGTALNVYNITVMNYAPPVPRDIELLDNPVGDPPPANSDSGRSQFDNVTRVNTPTLIFRLDDAVLLNDIQGNSAGNNPPNGVVIPIPFQAAAGTAGYRVAIFDEGPLPIPGTTAPQTPLGFATFVSPGVYQFTTPALLDGSHFLTARVQIVDPSAPQQSGFGERSVALEVVVDRVEPTGFFGQINLADTTQGLAAASDSGVAGVSATFVDRVTSDTTPSFYGLAEANAIVRVYAETNNVAGLQSTGAGADLFLGLTVADPLDGTNQFPGGQWAFTTPLDLNNPSHFVNQDGTRSLYMTSEDLAGNVTADAAADRLNIFLDTAGPQITNVEVTGSPTFNLFGIKLDNSVESPTPRVDSLTIRIQDLPIRSNLDPNFLYAALVKAIAETPGNIILRGDHSGIIAIQGVNFTGVAANGTRATGSIVISFVAPLPDDRYTLTIKENVVDPVGNKLDGESNAAQPIGNPTFASGDGQPGGDFVARFTVDSRPEIGTVSQGLVYVDINGNYEWDPTGNDNDATNRDFVMQIGTVSDAHFAGNFARAGAVAASGYDKMGVYGILNGTYSFLIDTDDDGVGDVASAMPPAYQVNGIPVAGNFSAAHPGDEIGLFDGTYWYLDTNGNNQIDLGERIASNFNGIPVVGNFDNDPDDELATYDNATNTFHFDLNRDGLRDVSMDVRDTLLRFGGLSGFTDRPVAGDLNLDGIDDLGLWVKGRSGQLPENAGEYFFWVSDRIAASPVAIFDAFSPAPLGNDLFAQFGDENALPVFGNFDPPVEINALPELNKPLHNAHKPLDVNRDERVTVVDALLVIGTLNSARKSPIDRSIRGLASYDYRKVDTDGNGRVTAHDVLLVIAQLNRRSTGEGEGADENRSEGYAVQADEFFAQFDVEELAIAKRRTRLK